MHRLIKLSGRFSKKPEIKTVCRPRLELRQYRIRVARSEFIRRLRNLERLRRETVWPVLSGVKVYLIYAGLRAVVNPVRSVDKLNFFHNDCLAGTMDIHRFGCQVPDEHFLLSGFQAVAIGQVVRVGVRIAASIEQRQCEPNVRDMLAAKVAKLDPELRFRRRTLMVVTQFNPVDDDRAFGLSTPRFRSHHTASEIER